MQDDVMQAMRSARLSEKAQALFYRSLAAQAEERDDAELSERFNALHADEQHHLSRLSVRLLELGDVVSDARPESMADANIDRWRDDVHRREQAEVDRYEQLLRLGPDAETRRVVEEILEVERQHLTHMEGKWTRA